MPPAADSRRHGEDGTASVELIATVPFLLFVLAVHLLFDVVVFLSIVGARYPDQLPILLYLW